LTFFLKPEICCAVEILYFCFSPPKKRGNFYF